MAKLAGGVALIKVGAATEVEMKEKKARVEDALHATRAAVEEGIVAGGGVALIRARKALDKLKGDNHDQDAGIKIVVRALEEPLRQIVANAGAEPSVVLNKVVEGKGNFGFNAQTEEYGDLVEMGVVDPTKVDAHRAAERGVRRRPDAHHRRRRSPSWSKRRRTAAAATATAAWAAWAAWAWICNSRHAARVLRVRYPCPGRNEQEGTEVPSRYPTFLELRTKAPRCGAFSLQSWRSRIEPLAEVLAAVEARDRARRLLDAVEDVLAIAQLSARTQSASRPTASS